MTNFKKGLPIKMILLYIFLIFGQIVQGQTGLILSPKSKDTNKMSIIDSCKIKVWYAFNADNIDSSDTYVDLQILEIGNKTSKYYSYFTFNSDSLCTSYINKNSLAKSRPRRLGSGGKYPNHWSEYKYSEYFTDYVKNAVTEYCRMPIYLEMYNSQSTENILTPKWQLYSDTIHIEGYVCQKATCSFRGRNYIAWFTMEIPSSSGPWKFKGLPGLILKIGDNNDIYSFECVRIDLLPNKAPIKIYDYSSYKKVDRLKLLKYHREIHENYYRMTGMRSTNGKPLPPLSPYIPLELE